MNDSVSAAASFERTDSMDDSNKHHVPGHLIPFIRDNTPRKDSRDHLSSFQHTPAKAACAPVPVVCKRKSSKPKG